MNNEDYTSVPQCGMFRKPECEAIIHNVKPNFTPLSAYAEQHSLRLDEYGYPVAIEFNGRTIIHLLPSEYTVANAAVVIARLNSALKVDVKV